MIVVAFVLASEFCRADDYAYIERWATGTLTTGEAFESWRIHVVVPDADDWVAAEIYASLTGGPMWYYREGGGLFPVDPNGFFTYPDADFATYITSAHLYPNSELVGYDVFADAIPLATSFSGTWGDLYYDTDGDYVVFQGTVLEPTAGSHGTIDFAYSTAVDLDPRYYTFVIPEPATAALLAPGAWTLLRRQRCRAGARSFPHA